MKEETGQAKEVAKTPEPTKGLLSMFGSFPGLSKKVIVISLLITFIVGPLNTFMYGPSSGQGQLFHAPGAMLYLIIAFNLIAVKLSKKWKMAPQEFVLLTIPLNFSCFYGFGNYFLVNATWPMYREPARTRILSFFPEWLGVKDSALVRGAFVGKSAVPWAEWTIPLIGWFIVISSIFFVSYFVMEVWRKPFLKIEEMPLPRIAYVAPAVEWGSTFDNDGTTARYFSWAKGKWILLGSALALYTGLPSWLSWGGIPYPPQIFNFNINMNFSSAMNTILPATDGNFSIYPIPGFEFFFSMDVLATMSVMQVLYAYVLPTIYWSQGAITNPATGGLWYTNPYYQLAYGSAGIFGGGLWWGMGILPFIFHRHHMIDSIKSALGRGPKLPEEENHWSYRTIWLGLGVAMLVASIVFTAFGCPFIISLVTMLMYVVFMTACAVVTNETGNVGLYTEQGYTMLTFPLGQTLGYWGAAPTGANQGVWGQNMASGLCFNRMRETPIAPSVYNNIYEAHWLAEYQEKRQGIKPQGRTIGMWIVVMGLLAIAVQLVFGIWANYAQGMDVGQRGAFMIWRQGPAAATYGNNFAANWMFTTGYTSTWATDSFNIITGLVGGFAFTAVIYWLRSMFSWFFLNPAGIFIIMWYSYGFGIIYVTLVKWLILRFGGPKIYNDIAVPFIAGNQITGLAFMGIRYMVTLLPTWLPKFFPV